MAWTLKGSVTCRRFFALTALAITLIVGGMAVNSANAADFVIYSE